MVRLGFLIIFFAGSIVFGVPSVVVFAQQSSQDDAVLSCDPCLGKALAVVEDDGQDGSCQELWDATRLLPRNSVDCKNAQLRNYQNECCRSTPHDHNYHPCTLCPDATPFDATAVVPNLFDPDGGSTTCADVNLDESFLDYLFKEGDCSDTLLQRSAAWCGCPNVERSCFLCPDGSKPPNLHLVDPVFYGWTCEAFDFVSSYFSKEECQNLASTIFEFDAASFCGCPDSPIPQVCQLCPDGQEIIRPHEMLVGGEFTCEELALSTRYIPLEGPCHHIKKSYHAKGYVDYCCGPARSGATRSLQNNVSRVSMLLLLMATTKEAIVALLL